MKENKHIQRDEQATKIFDNRSLDIDYRTLKPILKKGMSVLDVGCGTGAISKDVAEIVGPTGVVIGIDNTEKFIVSGKQTYEHVKNLELTHVDLLDYTPHHQFDLIISARVLQWLSDPKGALLKMKSMLKPGGQISILDYNHEELEWVPQPPSSMKTFYQTFLKWRKNAGMNNRIADDLPYLLTDVGFHSVQKINSDEYYSKDREDFKSRVGIWSKVAASKQMVEEGYLDDDLRTKALKEYNSWIDNECISMTMKLNEVRGTLL
jgi:ubiquinone/menaquinone biosynthesis C-methylase UbiE